MVKRIDEIRALLSKCTAEERASLFHEMRGQHIIHEFETVIGAPAEMILEAVHRAPELTRRMLRGVIADAAFRSFVIPAIEPYGWADITPEGNFAFDYLLDDGVGPVSIQVKLQRSERGVPLVRLGLRYGLAGSVFVTETQKTRTGVAHGFEGTEKTRPYRYGEFDILAVSMQPSTKTWDSYMYIPSRWLVPGKGPNEIATLQPVTMHPGAFWTDKFEVAVQRLRGRDEGQQMRFHVPKRLVRSKEIKKPRK